MSSRSYNIEDQSVNCGEVIKYNTGAQAHKYTYNERTVFNSIISTVPVQKKGYTMKKKRIRPVNY